jgi:hypothetical protein
MALDMTSLIERFMPPGHPVATVTTPSNTTIVLASQGVRQRWRHTRMYPAFRWTARAYRLLVRARVALGIVPIRPHTMADWPLEAFVRDDLPNVDGIVITVGTHGSAQKATLQLWCGPVVAGYLKFAAAPAAIARLDREHTVLSALPDHVRPAVVRFGDVAGGRALLTRPVHGTTVSVALPLRSNVRGFLAGLRRPVALPLDEHPWVKNMRARVGDDIDPWLDALSARSWPVVYQHGDFVPWNVLEGQDRALTAIDWEYGSTDGFPFLDEAFFVLQVGALLRRWSPARAREYAIRHLDPSLATEEAAALVRLAAFHAYHATQEDGHGPDEPLQAWRRSVWEH